VVVTLCEHRDLAEQTIKEWTQHQTFDQDAYELVVIGTGCDSQMESGVRALLRKQDLFVDGGTENPAELYDKGIRAAHGRYVFINESHSLPEPDCLEKITGFLAANPQYSGAFCRNVGTSEHYIGRMEDRVYQEDPLEQADHWNKVTIRGSMMPRDLYLELGGFERELGHFAEVALGIKLHESGRRLSVATDAVVHHFGAESFTELTQGLADYGVAEMHFRATNDAGTWIDYLGSPDTWAQRSE